MPELTDKEKQKKAQKKLLDALEKLHLAGVKILDDSGGRPRILGSSHTRQVAETVVEVVEDRLSPFIAEAVSMFDLEGPHGTDPYNKWD